MSELSQFINCLIAYQVKVEGHLKKSTNPSLAKSTTPDKLVSSQTIVFQL